VNRTGNPLRHDYTAGVTWCRARLHAVDPDATPNAERRRCIECRRASRRAADYRYRGGSKEMLRRIRSDAKRRGGK